MQRWSSLPRIAILLVLPYMLAFNVAVTSGGPIAVVFRVAAMTLLALTLGTWALGRILGRWQWHPTALDLPLVFWVAAFLVAELANPEMVRRGLLSAWYVTALLIGWYMLHDALANRAITRADLVVVPFLIGVIHITFVLYELIDPNAINNGLFGLPRVDGVTGNPNLLSAVLVPLIGLTIGRIPGLRRWRRMMFAIIGVAMIAALGLTYSRGGWLGGGVTIGVLLLAFAVEQGWTTRARLRAAWERAAVWQRSAVVAVIAGTLIAGIAVSLVLLASLNESGREAGLRTYLWETAWNGFIDKPLTGSGLYTTPRLILDSSSVPPRTAQPHAHNFPLQILAEFGVLGGVAMIVTLNAVLRAGIKAWRSAGTSHERYLIAGGWAGAVGFGVHLLVDLAAWVPYVALTGLITLMVMTASPAPDPLPARRQRLAAWACAAVAAVLLLTGVYGVVQFTRYNEILMLGQREDSPWLEAADQLEALIDSDPRQPVYHWTQAMLYAMAAYRDQDPALAKQAIACFFQAAEWGMDSAALQVNLAGLHAQFGDLDSARRHLDRAIEYASVSVPVLTYAALNAEAWGMPDLARSYWVRLLAFDGIEGSNIALVPGVAQSAVAAEFELPPLRQDAAAVPLLIEGRFDEAMALLDAHPEWRSSRAYAFRAVVAAELGGNPQPLIQAAQDAALNSNDPVWVRYARAYTAGEDLSTFASMLDPALLNVRNEPATAAIPTLHFQRPAFARMIVPQFRYDQRDPALAALVPFVE